MLLDKKKIILKCDSGSLWFEDDEAKILYRNTVSVKSSYKKKKNSYNFKLTLKPSYGSIYEN